MHRKLVQVFLQAAILSMHLPAILCAKPKCPDDAFNCGSIVYLAYPFWGGSRPQECGKDGHQIECLDGVPILNISSLSYRVTELNFKTNTIKLSRQDLWNNRCPKVLLNTTIDLDLFEYPPKSTYQNLTLYYQCSDPQQKLPNQFSCGAQTANFFETGDVLSGPGPNIRCKDSIFVPISKESARSLQNPTASSLNVLQAALNYGFSIVWVFDQAQRTVNFCNRNVYGSCVPKSVFHTRNCSYATCKRVRGYHASAPQQHQGMPPVQTAPSSGDHQTGQVFILVKGWLLHKDPPTPPQSLSYNPPPGNGMSPAQRPRHTPQNISYNPPSGNGSNSRISPARKIEIAVLLCITGAVIASIIMFCFIKRQYSSKEGKINRESNQYVEKFLVQHGSLAPKRYKYSEIKKITKSFSDKLGKGGYGSVYKGMLPDGSLVAVKVLMETESNGEEFINEVASISRTSHVNIVALLGFCYERSKRALIYEYMPNKSLDKFLSNKAETDCLLDLQKLFEISVGIAKGLEYLHTGCSTRIVHFDIKPQNILLDEDLCPKISDFGLAKLCKKKQSILSVLGTRGTIGYIAPEVFSRNFGGVSHKSDVYSYGMMVLEMVGAKNVVETHDVAPSSENYFPDKIYEQVILDVTNKVDDLMIEEEEETRRKMFLIGFWCIQTIPSDRPSMSKVGQMLEGSLQSIQIPPKPFLFTPSLPNQEFSSTFSAHVETENSAQDLIQSTPVSCV